MKSKKLCKYPKCDCQPVGMTEMICKENNYSPIDVSKIDDKKKLNPSSSVSNQDALDAMYIQYAGRGNRNTSIPEVRRTLKSLTSELTRLKAWWKETCEFADILELDVSNCECPSILDYMQAKCIIRQAELEEQIRKEEKLPYKEQTLPFTNEDDFQEPHMNKEGES